MTDASDNQLHRNPWPARVALLGIVVALGAALSLVLAPLGYRAGLLSLRTALLEVPRTYVFYAGIAGAVISLAALLVTGANKRVGWVAVAVVGLILGAGSAYVPWKFAQMDREAPPVNDITTDTANPPAFEAVMPLREAAKAEPVTYSADFPAMQSQAYPDIKARYLTLPVDRAFSIALDAVHKMGWKIVAADGERGRIEATDTTTWYGFTDDVVVRVSAEGDLSRIDIRSKSRIGRGDFGTNARRVRAYLAAVKSIIGSS